MLFATAVHATVPTASPIEPPTCWPVFSRLEATPATAGWTQGQGDHGQRHEQHARQAPGDQHQAGQPAGVVAVLADAGQPEQPAGRGGPAISSGRAPIRGTSWALAPDIAMIAAIIGR